MKKPILEQVKDAVVGSEKKPATREEIGHKIINYLTEQAEKRDTRAIGLLRDLAALSLGVVIPEDGKTPGV